MKRPRLLVLTQYYRPEIAFITADVAEAMTTEWDVTVVTAQPNYPFGRLLPGWGGVLPRRSVEGDVAVWRLPLWPYHGNSLVGRAACYGTFAAAATAAVPLLGGAPDLVWVYQTPFTTPLAALWPQWVGGAKVIHTSADLWPESLLAAGVARDGGLVGALQGYRRFINRRADHIVCATAGMLERYAEEGIPRERLTHIPIWIEGVGPLADPPPAGEVPRVVYVGNIGPAQQLDCVLDAAELLRASGVQVRFELYGAGAMDERLRDEVRRRGLSGVTLPGAVPPERAFALSATADLLLVPLRADPRFIHTVPSKLGFCLGAGRPVLAGLHGESRRVAEASGAAWVFDPADPASLARAVTEALATPAARRAEMGRAGRAYFERHFERSRLVERYRALFHAVRTGTSQPREGV